jgi:hypothetical protein
MGFSRLPIVAHITPPLFSIKSQKSSTLGRMPLSSPDRVRRFKATFGTLAEATSFLGRFRGKFGYLDGHGYSVSETGTGNGPAIGPVMAFVSFSPWRHQIAEKEWTDFARLLTDAEAREISN